MTQLHMLRAIPESIGLSELRISRRDRELTAAPCPLEDGGTEDGGASVASGCDGRMLADPAEGAQQLQAGRKETGRLQA